MGDRPGTAGRRDRITSGGADGVLLALSRAITQFGSMLTVVVVALQLRPHGSWWVAAAMAAEFVPAVVLAPGAGRVLDRVPNRPVMLAAYAVQAVAAALLALGPAVPVLVVVLLVVVGAGAAVAGPAQAALVPLVAGSDEEAARVFGRLTSAGMVGVLGGLALAGALTEWIGPRAALLVDAGTFAAQALLVAAIRARRTPGRDVGRGSAPGRGPGSPARSGFGILLTDRLLRITTLGLAVAVLASVVVNVASVFLVVGELHASPALYGLVEASWAAGALVGGWAAGRVRAVRGQAVLVLAAGAVMGSALATAGLAVRLPATFAAWLVAGAANAGQNVGIQALISRRVAQTSRAAAFGALAAVLGAANGVSLTLGATLVAAAGASTTLVVAGIACTAAGGLGLLAVTGLPDAVARPGR